MATNQQRREAAKRKLERQLTRRAERAKRRRIIGVGVTIVVVGLVAGLVVFLVTRDREDVAADPAASDSPSTPAPIQIPTERAPEPKRPQPLADPVSCEYPVEEGKPAAKPVNAPAAGQVASNGTVGVTMKTTAGDIPLTLNKALAPCTVNSFVNLVNQGFYTDTECHRLGTEGLQMLQCGDPQATGMGGPGYTFDDEVFPELSYGRGILAMANAGKDPATGKGTNGSQFFMVYGDAQLPPNYTVFGTIGDPGLEVLDKVARDGIDAESAATSQDGTGKPKTPVKFTAATVG
ncbi:peptidylprolyl isomerase [Amycolatopsis magusensis]|uniref:Peptidyl-prolyl cis-trans isomerase B (Cyclophilin B) n=1 Tax=Amycolatopsis magusensis TaxID=882444 RepID=A0ABS4Q0S5_9PSEU|nr:peptidylprolyl isomerase [Amycolatopsis magusensis]MBP2185272.1 peptidyl-prolyl cis-trans isomerase B (cyclophilin B) [Amycolatopsis magusensis]MDI5980622.1 peptidylprolyl isomerase [Amycolatopsis magusensis]UJW28909.1 peptidylprolyl isomerase [Saccharothrix sp. AJ9571]